MFRMKISEIKDRMENKIAPLKHDLTRTHARKRCALTVDVESDLREINFSDVGEIYSLLDIFNELNIFCTFFFTGRFMEMMPKIVNHVARSGHEIALHGYAHDSWKGGIEAKIEDLKKLSELMSSLRMRPLGFRAPCLSISNRLFILLKSLGFAYDSSLFENPIFKPLNLFFPNLYNQPSKKSTLLVEFPLSTTPFFRLPYSLNWLLFLGSTTYKSLTEAYTNEILIFYLHPYDLLPKPQRFGVPYPFRFLGRKNSKKAFLDFLTYLLNRGFRFVRLADELHNCSSSVHPRGAF